MNQKLEATNLNASLESVLAMLGSIQTVLDESPNVLKQAMFWPEEVYPGEQSEDEMTLPVIGLLIHVQGGVWLAMKGVCFLR